MHIIRSGTNAARAGWNLVRKDIVQMTAKMTMRLSSIILLIPVLTITIPAPVQGQEKDPILGSYTWRQIGPANMSGRVSDLAVPPGGEASTIYVAAAAGGLWKTVNNGSTWKQVFQGGKTAAVGDIAIAPSNPDIIYIGMGEPHSRNSISWGDGVYKSTDGGESWRHTGLDYTYHIGRIVVDPRDPQIVYVAALGNLWDKYKGDRGLYKSEDGGITWKKLMGFDDGTGFYDVILDPKNPDVVYATSWERDRKPWVILSGGGPNNGIWKSIDAGATWTRLEGGGLPPSDQNGKISLAIFPQNPDIIYARIENFATDPSVPEPEQQADRPAQFRGRGTSRSMNGTYRSDDGGQTWKRFDRRNGRAFYYCQVRVDPQDANTVYLIESNLYKVDVEEAAKWVDNFEQSSQQRGMPGQTQEYRGVTNITGSHHVDFHAMWIDPYNSDHLIVGSDGGVAISWDQGEKWDFLDNLALGQFYAVGYDMAQPYNVYGGLQDNGTWGGPHMTRTGSGIKNKHWESFLSGDGFHAQVDPEDPDIILYGESQGGAISRFNRATGMSQSIRPRAPRRQSPNMSDAQRQFMQQGGMRSGTNISPQPEPGISFRFNWSSPIILSPHNPKTIYFGGNYLFKSVNRGDTWSIISPDLTTADTTKTNATNRGDTPTGAERHCTIITIGESPLVAGLIWVGTDDGLVHITKDGGVNWTEVTDNLQGVPKNTWVSRVRPSGFEAGRAYVTFDGHRMGDLTTYVFRTQDYGQTWKRLGGGLPTDDPAYVITEDPFNENLIYLGTESGVYISLDMGESWTRFNNNLPVVPVHDLVVHSRDRDLIIGTHGLSIWVMDDVSGLQALTPDVMEKDFELFDVQPVIAWNSRYEQNFPGDKLFAAENPPTGFKLGYWISRPVEKVDITIHSVDGAELRTVEGSGESGLNIVEIPLRPSFSRFGGGGGRTGAGQPGQAQLRPLSVGSFRLTVTYGEETATKIIEVLPDPKTIGRN